MDDFPLYKAVFSNNTKGFRETSSVSLFPFCQWENQFKQEVELIILVWRQQISFFKQTTFFFSIFILRTHIFKWVLLVTTHVFLSENSFLREAAGGNMWCRILMQLDFISADPWTSVWILYCWLHDPLCSNPGPRAGPGFLTDQSTWWWFLSSSAQLLCLAMWALGLPGQSCLPGHSVAQCSGIPVNRCDCPVCYRAQIHLEEEPCRGGKTCCGSDGDHIFWT